MTDNLTSHQKARAHKLNKHPLFQEQISNQIGQMVLPSLHQYSELMHNAILRVDNIFRLYEKSGMHIVLNNNNSEIGIYNHKNDAQAVAIIRNPYCKQYGNVKIYAYINEDCLKPGEYGILTQMLDNFILENISKIAHNTADKGYVFRIENNATASEDDLSPSYRKKYDSFAFNYPYKYSCETVTFIIQPVEQRAGKFTRSVVKNPITDTLLYELSENDALYTTDSEPRRDSDLLKARMHARKKSIK